MTVVSLAEKELTTGLCVSVLVIEIVMESVVELLLVSITVRVLVSVELP